MTPDERARSLAGDMPWVTASMTEPNLEDFISQVAACIRAALKDQEEDAAWQKSHRNERRGF